MNSANGNKMMRETHSWKTFLTILLAFASLIVITTPKSSYAIAGWSEKYKVSCQTCHSPAFARLNLDGEKFMWNGYQSPDDDVPDGDVVGKRQLGSNLAVEKSVRDFFMARLNITPLQVVTNGQVVNGKDTVSKVTIANTPWMQMFIAGSIAKNISIYIENEFEAEGFQFSWYYMTFTNLLGSKLANLQVGRLSPMLFMPFPDRLPMLPALGKPAVTRIASSNGKGDASLDARSARSGIQYYGYAGPVMVFAGVTPGSKTAYAGQVSDLGYWGGGRLFVPETKTGGSLLSKLEGSSIGFEYMKGTDIKGTKTMSENNWSRIMPGLNLRWGDKIDIQATYVIANEDNWNLDTLGTAKKKITFQGDRIFATYNVTEKWLLQGSWDNYWADNSKLLSEERRAYFPVITYLARENIRLSLYPGIDLRDVDDNLKHHEFLTNIRVGF